MNRFWQKYFTPARTIMVTTTFASYFCGLLRDRLFAHTYGAGRDLDAYQAAFLLPDFLLNFLVAGGLMAVFVPLFLEINQRNKKRSEMFARTVTTFFTLLMIAVGILVFIFAEKLSYWVAPGFNPYDREKLIGLMHVLAWSPVIFAFSNALGGILVAENKFLTYGLSPVFYNLGIIGGTFLFTGQYGIMGAAYGTIIGAFLHLGVRIYELRNTPNILQPMLKLNLPEFKPFFKLMLPKMFGHPVELATLWGFTAIASLLVPGSIAVLNFSRNFQSVPISIIGIAFATVSFSALSDLYARKNISGFWTEYRRTLKHITYLSLGTALLMFIFRRWIVSLLLGGGEFGPDAVDATAAMLGGFTLSIPLEAVSQIQARAFYAAKNTFWPTAVGFVNFGLSVGGAWILAKYYGPVGMPIGYALGSIAKVGLLWMLLPMVVEKNKAN